jgi:hypothetical protein
MTLQEVLSVIENVTARNQTGVIEFDVCTNNVNIGMRIRRIPIQTLIALIQFQFQMRVHVLLEQIQNGESHLASLEITSVFFLTMIHSNVALHGFLIIEMFSTELTH